VSKKPKVKVPFFGRHRPNKKGKLIHRLPHDVKNVRNGSMVSNNTSKISTASSKSSISNGPNGLDMLQIAGTNFVKGRAMPKKSHAPMTK
jgi:hypothetical protein